MEGFPFAIPEIIPENLENTRVLQPFDTNKSKLNDFLSWIKSTSIVTNKIEIVYYGSVGIGVQATNDIQINEIVLTIPEEYFINLETVKNFNNFQHRTELNKIEWNGPKHTAFAAFLLINRKESNTHKHRNYFEMLPERMYTNPLLYDDKDLDSLIGTDYLVKIKLQKKQIKKDYDLLIKHMPEYSVFSFEEFCNNRLIVASRVFGYEKNGLKSDTLLPYGEFINPGIKNVNWSYSPDKKAFNFYTINKISKGEAIKVSFGKKSNIRFLTNYGFIEMNNFLENEINIEFPIDDSVVFQKEVKEFYKIGEDNYLKLTLKWNLDIILEILEKIRKILSGKIKDEKNENVDNINIKFERIVIERLGELIAERKKKYPTSYEEDQKLKKDFGNLNLNERNCLIARMDEKETLKAFEELLEGIGIQITLLENETQEIDKVLYEGYIENIIKIKKN